MNPGTGLGLLAGVLTAVQAAEVTPPCFSLTNPRPTALREVARVAVPLPAGWLHDRAALSVAGVETKRPVQVRAITRHPDGSVRRAMLSFPVELAAGQALDCRCEVAAGATTVAPLAQFEGTEVKAITDAFALQFEAGELRLTLPDGAELGLIRAFGPNLAAPVPARLEVIENGPSFGWWRWRQDGSDFTREVDVEVDCLGRVRLVQRLLRHLKGNAWTPDFGFEAGFPGAAPLRLPPTPVRFLSLPVGEPIARHPELVVAVKTRVGLTLSLTNPLALRQHRGSIEVRPDPAGPRLVLSRLEPVAKETDNLQHQEGAWQTIECVLQPGPPEALAAAVDQPLVSRVDWRAFDVVYHCGPPLTVQHPVLRRLVEQLVVALEGLALKGDDYGSLGGLERYNHCAYLWDDWFRTGDPRLRRLALDYSENYSNFSVNWGPDPACYGGSRYPANARTQPWPGSFRTRQNDAVTFCTKGYHGFWLAYEETGDPRFRYAAEQQARWSAEHVHATVNYTRCIGQVTDFVKLYEYAGERSYLDEAVRLWGELQPCQDPDLLFNERGVPSTGNDLYIPDDRFGYEHPFVKSYILQYATNALPDLLRHRPEDQRLRDTILVGNDWMTRVQTPGGGWSYPGPTTAGLGWNPEYAHGLMLAHAVEPKPTYLDAVQRELRAIVTLFDACGAIASRITPWETIEGLTNDELGQRYRLGVDRDRGRDFTAGRVDFGINADFGVYFQVLLRDYLVHRSEDSLFTPDETLTSILGMRTSQDGPYPQAGDPSLRLSVTTTRSDTGLAATFAARGIYRLSGKALAYRWLLPDGSQREGAEATWTFGRAGAFAVKLTARDGEAEFARSVTVTAPCGPGDLGWNRWPQGLRVQAEAFEAQGGGESGVKARTPAEKLGSDAGSISHWNAVNAWVEWAVEVREAGRYALLLKYASPEPAQRQVAVDGPAVGTFSLPPTGGYSGPAVDQWGLAVLQDATGAAVPLELGPGQHRLRLTNTDGHGCNLDYLELLPWSQTGGE